MCEDTPLHKLNCAFQAAKTKERQPGPSYVNMTWLISWHQVSTIQNSQSQNKHEIIKGDDPTIFMYFLLGPARIQSKFVTIMISTPVGGHWL